MALQKDSQGNIIQSLDTLGGATLIDARTNTATLAVLNAEIVMPCANTNSASIDIRGTFVGTFVLEYSFDGVNYNGAPIFNPITELYVPGITAVGSYTGNMPTGCKFIKVRCSAFTSGSATVALRGSAGMAFIYTKQIPVTAIITTTAATGVGATATLPAAGAGLFHYISRILIQRHTSALLTPGATPTVITTTNLSGSLAFSIPADAAAQGTVYTEIMELGNSPLKSSAANTATTIVAPVTTGVIWRITVFYYIGQ